MKYFSARTFCSLGMRVCFLLLLFACGSPSNTAESSAQTKRSSVVIRSSGLKILDGDIVFAESKSNMRFALSELIMAPLSKELNDVLLSTSAYLIENPEKSLNIEGLYEAQESNKSVLPNLGLARANSLKQIFMAYGVSADRIVLSSREETLLQIRAGFVNGPIAIRIGETMDKAPDLLEIEKDFFGKSKNVYLEKLEGEIELNPELREYFADLLMLLDARSEMKITLTGHSDNRGQVSTQRVRGLNRANSLKEQLVVSGFKASRIVTTSKGTERPIASNDTVEGRALNERVEIFIEN